VIHYAPPSVLRISPLSTEGGEVQIMGENLGTAANAEAGALRITFDGVAATGVSVMQDHKKVRCFAPEGLGSVRVRAVLTGLSSQEHEAFFGAPEVHALDPPDLDLGGGEIELTGVNFGAVEGRIRVLLPDVGGEVTSVQLVEAHRKIRVAVPPIPSGSRPGEPLRMRVVVAGVYAPMAVDLVYSPPGGVAASEGRPAYITRRRVLGELAPGQTPLAGIFAAPLAIESGGRRGGGGGGGTPAKGGEELSRGSSAPAAKAGGGGALASPVVRGSLAGEGPTLSITPQSKWQPDTELCTICTRDFNLSRRRHHCRVCGSCVCGSCSPFELRLSSNAPTVRICSRCNLRVGLLTSMTACLDAIEGAKKILGPDTELYAFFKEEVIRCVSTPLAATPGSTRKGGAATPAAAGTAAATPVKASLSPMGPSVASGASDE
jgi:hypothetical protein